MSDTGERESAPVASIGADPDAFEVFYCEHVALVERFVTRRVSDPHLVADLVVEVFLAAIDGAHGYLPERGSVLGWLYGVARNVVAAELRRQVHERTLVRRISGRRLLTSETLAGLEERIDAERQSRQLYTVLAELREQDRALLELVALDGLSVADAARVLALSPGTARVQLHRSRQRLKSKLADTELPVYATEALT